MGIITKEIKEFVNKVKLGFVATVCPDGTPNLSPKGTTIAWDDEHLAFADIHSPGTIENLQLNPAVEINVVDIFTRKGYRFKGVGKVYSDGPIFEKVIAYFKEAGSKHTIKNIVLIKIDRAMPVFSPAYDTGLSEYEVRNRWIEYWNSIYPKT
jgi:predicted pyridoxine 5'-phosphate oxidase superfamily flavin-nucleotide-binding protein